MTKVSRQLNITKIAGPKPAFTLVEIIVVLFIVSIGLVGVLSLIVQNIQSQSYDKNNLIANHLAQEGIELIRKVRDSNWKKSQSFNTNLASAQGNVYQYYMDYQNDTPQTHTVPSDLVLKQDSSGFYVNFNRAASSTIFSRLLMVQLVNTYSLQVDSIVTWSDHSRNFSYDLQTLLYDWR